MPKPAFVSSSQMTTESGTSLVVPVPEGATTGHVMICMVYKELEPAFTAPGGWTSISQISDVTAGVRMQVWYRAAGASEPTDYTWSWTGATVARAVCLCYSGCDVSDPIDGASFYSTASPAVESEVTDYYKAPMATRTPSTIYEMAVYFACNKTGGTWQPETNRLQNVEVWYHKTDGNWNTRYNTSNEIFCADILNLAPTANVHFAQAVCSANAFMGAALIMLNPDPTWLATITATTAAVDWGTGHSGTWKYKYDDTDNFASTPKFYEDSFDYSGWTDGQQGFGFGTISGLEYSDASKPLTRVTTLTNPSTTRNLYAKRTFTIVDKSLVVGVRICLSADDAIACWINGTLVCKLRCPDPAVTTYVHAMNEATGGGTRIPWTGTGSEYCGTYGIRVTGTNDEGRGVWYELSDAQIAALNNGTDANYVSIAVFQSDSGSSDFGGGCRILVDTKDAPAGVTIPLVMHHRKQQG